MSKEVTKKETASLALHGNAWGAEGIDMADVVIPKILLMQGQSKDVTSGKAKIGDIIRSVNSEVIGSKDKGLEFIPITSFKTWVVSENTGSRFEFRAVEPITAENVNAPLEWNAQGKTFRRDRVLNFYVLLPKDILREKEALKIREKTGRFPSPSDALFPCVLSVKRTSYGVGKTLITHFAMAQQFGVPPASTTFKLKSKMETKDKNNYWVFDLEEAGATSEEDLGVCRKWYDTISKTKVVVDNSDLEEKSSSGPSDLNERTDF